MACEHMNVEGDMSEILSENYANETEYETSSSLKNRMIRMRVKNGAEDIA